MKKFVINISTYWGGMDDKFRAVADTEEKLYNVAESLAYDNFELYGCVELMAEDNGYDPEDMEEEDWDKLYKDMEYSDYYDYCVEEFTGSEEEWEEIGGEIYSEED